jgi:hypothetical protein
MSAWTHDGSRLFTGNSPIVWADLDLKLVDGGVGNTLHPTAHSLALLKVENSVGSPLIGFRTNGKADNTYITVNGGHGCCSLDPNSATSDAAMVLVPTDSVGKVEWIASAAVAIEVWLVGFVQATEVDLEVRADSAMPSSWTALDLTQDVLAAATGLTGEAFAYVWIERTGGSQNDWATRPADPGYAEFLGGFVQGGCSQGGYNNVNDVEGIAQKTDTSGEIEIISASPVTNAEIRMASFEQDGFASCDIEVFAAASPPLSWTTLDLSAYVGARRALVMLQVHYENTGSGLVGSAFRTLGDASDYLPGINTDPMGVSCCSLYEDDRTIILAETDVAGKIEWIAANATRDIDLRLVGIIPATPPTPTGANQSPTDLLLLQDTNISFDLLDDYGLDMSTLVIRAVPAASTPIIVYTGGAWQTGWNGLISEQSPVFGSNPTKAAIRITDFSDAFILSSPRRYTMEVEISNVVGQAI